MELGAATKVYQYDAEMWQSGNSETLHFGAPEYIIRLFLIIYIFYELHHYKNKQKNACISQECLVIVSSCFDNVIVPSHYVVVDNVLFYMTVNL